MLCSQYTDDANSGLIQYYDLPQEMQDRMPSAYTRALKLPLRSPLAGEELYNTVLDLGLSYFLNYSMIFPPMNEISALVQYARVLCLPGTPSPRKNRLFSS